MSLYVWLEHFYNMVTSNYLNHGERDTTTISNLLIIICTKKLTSGQIMYIVYNLTYPVILYNVYNLTYPVILYNVYN